MTESNSPSTPQTTKKSSRLVGCLLQSFLGILALGVGAYFLQGWITPDVDEDITQPIQIRIGTNQNGTGKSKLGNSDSNAPTLEQLNLPEGAITARVTQKLIDSAEHPFDPLIQVAKLGIEEIDKKYFDYTATLVSQVQIAGTLLDEKHVFCKVRHAREVNGTKIPFSVYTLFLKPKANVGQEAIWVDGWHKGNLVAHGTGLLNVKRLYIDPNGPLAMEGNRHPIAMIGFRNLLVKMSQMDREVIKTDQCAVTINRNVQVGDRICTTIEATVPVKRDPIDFHIARIYIDDELNIPIGYEGFLWPEKEGSAPPIIERYFYKEIKLNVGLKDVDFEAGNKEYNYPSW